MPNALVNATVATPASTAAGFITTVFVLASTPATTVALSRDPVPEEIETKSPDTIPVTSDSTISLLGFGLVNVNSTAPAPVGVADKVNVVALSTVKTVVFAARTPTSDSGKFVTACPGAMPEVSATVICGEDADRVVVTPVLIPFKVTELTEIA